MACTDGKNTYLNIKELPEINDVIAGDFMIIETSAGTSIIDYQNFLITLDNTTFGDQVIKNTTDIATLSTDLNTSFDTLSVDLNTSFDTLSTDLNTTVNTLSTNLSTSFNTKFNTLCSDLTSDIASLSTTIANTHTFVVFSLTSYLCANSPVILKSSNVSSVTLNPTTSAVTIFYNINFSDANYCVTTGTTNTVFPVLVHNTSTTTNNAVFNILSAANVTKFSTAEKVCIQIINA